MSQSQRVGPVWTVYIPESRSRGLQSTAYRGRHYRIAAGCIYDALCYSIGETLQVLAVPLGPKETLMT